MSSRSVPAGFVRSWSTLASLGAGLVLIAISAGALEGTVAAGADGGTAVGAAVAGVALAGCGAAALGWGAFSLAAGRPAAPRAALVVALVVFGATGVALVSGVAPALGLVAPPLLAAELFVLVAAAGAAAELRRGNRGRREAAATRGTVLGLVAGAALVAALATPALAGTAAGEVAVPHGELHDPGHQHP